MYSDEIIEQIKQHAGLLLAPDQIALLLDLDLNQFKKDLRNLKSPVSIAYNKGKLDIIVEIRIQEINLAKLGSPMAVEQVAYFMLQQKLGEK